MVPELLEGEWEAWVGDPEARLECPTRRCGKVSPAFWNGIDETLTFTGCSHRAFIPECAITWPPPPTHTRRRN
ncbi:hypothetical protein [Streptomyces sp. NPDC059278]|uniref:hypothetical protein n=1 Tax=Streptomyces sp. NPDC059278 TaxID=3346801 RepID=UPI0036BB7267